MLVVDVPAAACTPAAIAKLKQLLSSHAGRTPVQVRFVSSNGVRPLDVGAVRVEPGAGLLSELRVLLGTDAARVVPRSRPAGPVVSVPEPAGTHA